MGSISPVIANFLAGQQAQQQTQDQASNWALKKQQLDQALKEFDANHQQEQEKIDQSAQLMKIHNDLAHAEMRMKIPGMVQSGEIPVSQQPGPPQQISASGSVAGLPIPGISVPTQQNVPVGTPMTVNDAFGQPYTFPRPQTNLEAQVAQANAMALPNIAAEKAKSAIAQTQWENTVGKENVDKLQLQGELADEKYRNVLTLMQDRTASAEKIQDSRNDAAMARAQLEITRGLINMGLPPDIAFSGNNSGNSMGQQLQQLAAQHGQAVALGQESLKDLSPIIKANTATYMSNNKIGEAPKGINDIYALGTNATRALNAIDNLYGQFAPLKPPTTIGGKLANMLSTDAGKQGLSQYASQYDMFKASILPTMDLAVGLTPGTMARSPKLYDKVAGLLPLQGDSPQVVARKQANTADIFLTSIQSKMAGLTPDHRKLIWNQILQSNPSLLNKGAVANQLKGALETGNYTSGGALKDILGGVTGENQ